MIHVFDKPECDAGALLVELLAVPLPIQTSGVRGPDENGFVFVTTTRNLTVAELAQATAAVNAHAVKTAAERLRAVAASLFAAADESAQRDRAIVLTLLDEINLLRDWVTRFKAATAGAATLASLKTAVAALPDVPQRTAAQAKTAVRNKINDGGAD